MEEQLVSFEVAKLLKRKGFNAPTDYIYNHKGFKSRGACTFNWNNLGGERKLFTSVPSQSLAQRWLRDTHSLFVHSFCNASGWAWQIDKCDGTFIKWSEYSGPNNGGE